MSEIYEQTNDNINEWHSQKDRLGENCYRILAIRNRCDSK